MAYLSTFPACAPSSFCITLAAYSPYCTINSRRVSPEHSARSHAARSTQPRSHAAQCTQPRSHAAISCRAIPFKRAGMSAYTAFEKRGPTLWHTNMLQVEPGCTIDVLCRLNWGAPLIYAPGSSSPKIAESALDSTSHGVLYAARPCGVGTNPRR